jgi:hypothetical protein
MSDKIGKVIVGQPGEGADVSDSCNRRYARIDTLLGVESTDPYPGTGLVGSAIRYTLETESIGSRFGRRENEEWIFLSSKDCDLR